ncbi:MAG: carboxylesterase family protein [Gammaproteobacteria bacterium]
MKGTWLVSMMALALATATAPAMAQIAQANVTGGKIAGAIANGVSAFKGIPFAAAPAGDLRWKAPQPVKAWSGVRQTTEFAAACMQNPASLKSQAPGISMSEDCLYLDVWTGAKTSREKLPVIAWIYGGGFNGGMTSAPLYDGANFAKHGVVFVSLSYRVGPLGFLATPDLSRESGHASGNYGMLDQIAGLKWIQKNIAEFGGDPSKVTVLGHSAGAFAVSMLAGSPLAKGLFRGAISESGANFMPPQDSSWGGGSIQTLRMSEAAGKTWLESLGASTLAEARALPAEKVEAAQRNQGAPRFWPAVDGYVITGDQYELWRKGRFNDTPILVGDVSDEAGGFGVRKVDAAAFEKEVREGYGEHADAILAAYPHGTDEQATRSATLLRSDTASTGGSSRGHASSRRTGSTTLTSIASTGRVRPIPMGRVTGRRWVTCSAILVPADVRRPRRKIARSRSRCRATGELCDEGRSEWRRVADLAGVYRSRAPGDEVRRRSRAGACREPGQAEGARRVL